MIKLLKRRAQREMERGGEEAGKINGRGKEGVGSGGQKQTLLLNHTGTWEEALLPSICLPGRAESVWGKKKMYSENRSSVI